MPEHKFIRVFKNTDEIEITVIGHNTGKQITLPVWFVHEKDTIWLFRVNGSKAQWYQNLLKKPTDYNKGRKRSAHLQSPSTRSRKECRQRDPVNPTKVQAGNDRQVLSRPLDAAVKLKL